MHRRFTIWVDDTPELPEIPLNAQEAINEFLRLLAEADDYQVEIRSYEG